MNADAMISGSDQEILSRSSVTIEMAGREYVWKERNRRESREMLAAMFPIIHQLMDSETHPEKALTAYNQILDFLYRWHPAMSADRKLLDDATTEEITKAFGQVKDLLEAPFVRDALVARRAAEEAARAAVAST